MGTVYLAGLFIALLAVLATLWWCEHSAHVAARHELARYRRPQPKTRRDLPPFARVITPYGREFFLINGVAVLSAYHATRYPEVAGEGTDVVVITMPRRDFADIEWQQLVGIERAERLAAAGIDADE